MKKLIGDGIFGLKVAALASAFCLTVALASPALEAANASRILVITASNDLEDNQLLAYDIAGDLVQTISTGGKGGATGNAGGIAAANGLIAVVNFSSETFSTFTRDQSGELHLEQVIDTVLSPVSVAFGHGHLYVLGSREIASYRLLAQDQVDTVADGIVGLKLGDGSAAQVGVAGGSLIVTEKNNTVETFALSSGAVVGPAVPVALPENSFTPFGLVTRGDNAYVTIAHSDKVALIKNGVLVAINSSGSEGAPCWLTEVGNFVYSANSPSHSVSAWKATGNNVVQAIAKAGTTEGAPTDIASINGLVAVFDTSGHITQFAVGQRGSLAELSKADAPKTANGLVVVDNN